jgi:type I restriction enzyme, S subunit
MPKTIGNDTGTKIAFGEVVHLSKVKTKDPDADGFDRYVGLEHLEPGDLKIRKWGNVADGTTFTNVFKPGQVLFGKRRAYQRKMAVADFGGVCSGDIYVLEPKGDDLLPELLPFICQTDAFFDHAVRTSAGSLSPRTNWKSLATFEFALPTPKEQQRLSTALRAVDRVCNAYRSVANAADCVFESLLEELLARGLDGQATKAAAGMSYAASWPLLPLQELASVERGKFSHRPRNLPKFFGGEYPFIQIGDIAESRGILGPATQFLSDEGVQISRSFPAGTVLISITGAVIGKTAITDREIWTTDSIVGIQPGKSMNPRFLEYVLRRLHPYLNGSLATLTTQKNINLEILRPLLVPFPDLQIQEEIVLRLLAVERASLVGKERSNLARRLIGSLLKMEPGA